MSLKMKSKGNHENFLNLTYTFVKSLAFYQALCNCDFSGQWAMVKSIGSHYWQDFCRSSRNTWYVSAFCNPPRVFPDISWNIFWRCIKKIKSPFCWCTKSNMIIYHVHICSRSKSSNCFFSKVQRVGEFIQGESCRDWRILTQQYNRLFVRICFKSLRCSQFWPLK